jgi:hypothetical protein
MGTDRKGGFEPDHRGFKLCGAPVAARRPAPIKIRLRGLTLAQIEAYAIRACHDYRRGNRRLMMADLGISKSTLLLKLDALGLRKPRAYVRGEALVRPLFGNACK